MRIVVKPQRKGIASPIDGEHVLMVQDIVAPISDCGCCILVGHKVRTAAPIDLSSAEPSLIYYSCGDNGHAKAIRRSQELFAESLNNPSDLAASEVARRFMEQAFTEMEEESLA